MDNNKILFISQEISPYLPDTPMSLQGRNLPQRIQEAGYEVRTFMPKYGCINERRNQLHEVIRLSGMNIVIDDNDHPLIIKVATLQPTRMQVYFIDNDDYFLRSGAKELETATSPDDNDERMMFYTRGVIETVRKLRWDPAVIQCTGWITALMPMYIRRMYDEDPAMAGTKIVFALREEAFDGELAQRFVEKLRMAGFTDDDMQALGIDTPVDYASLMRLAMTYADGIVQASEGVDPQLIEFAKATGKPFLPYVADEAEMAAGCISFYNTL